MISRRVGVVAIGCMFLLVGAARNGTYFNPVLPGDFSDIDAIRVGTDYYAISSTMQYSPGMAVLHSRDLVNWRIAGHVVTDLTRISPELNRDRMNRAGRGIWAGSIRYYDGLYYVYFGTPDEGLFMSTAVNPAGEWSPVTQVLRAAGWDDPCPFRDDDGSRYLLATHFQREEINGKTYNIHLFRLSEDGKSLVEGWDRIIHQSKGSEANKLYKIRGTYYHLYSEVAAEGRVIMMNRARSLDGPWETRQLIHVNKKLDKEPNQGGLIELPSGAWYFLSHQGTGSWEGRAGVLLPVTWMDGWPVIGRPGADGIGNMVWSGLKPIAGKTTSQLAVSDDFSEPRLRAEWEWHYQPRADKWSLRERPGFLRLHAFAPLRADDFRTAGNVLTQRAMRTERNVATVKLDLAGMADGQQAGLAHYAKNFCTLGVRQEGGGRVLISNDNGTVQTVAAVPGVLLWLRSAWNIEGVSRFEYSMDGRHFIQAGEACQLTWGNYRGDRIGIYTFNGRSDTGYVDVDAFQYTTAAIRLADGS